MIGYEVSETEGDITLQIVPASTWGSTGTLIRFLIGQDFGSMSRLSPDLSADMLEGVIARWQARQQRSADDAQCTDHSRSALRRDFAREAGLYGRYAALLRTFRDAWVEGTADQYAAHPVEKKAVELPLDAPVGALSANL